MSDEKTIKEENIEININENEKENEKEKLEPKTSKKKKNDECIELKNIQYKTMLLNGVQKEVRASKTEEDIENILELEKNLNLSVPWTKLEKGTKIKKLVAFSTVVTILLLYIDSFSNSIFFTLNSCWASFK